MDPNRMELSIDELEMVNGGDTAKNVTLGGFSAGMCALYCSGAGFVAGRPVGAAIGAAIGAAVGGISYGIFYLVTSD